MLAGFNGHKNIVRVLIKAGAEINRINDDRETALVAASQSKHDEIVDILVKAGAQSLV